MTRIVIDRHHVSLDYATDCMIIRVPDQVPRTVPLGRIEQLICMHNTQLTTQLIGQLYKRGIDFIVLNLRFEKSSYALFSDQARQVERRCVQYDWQLKEDRRLQLAKDLCKHKFKALENNLSFFKTDKAIRACKLINNTRFELDQTCISEDQLRGIEGNLQKVAFDCWREQIPATLGFHRRERRPPKDPVNSILSLAYTLVHQDAVRQAKRYGLDPYLGFYHRTAFGRHSLACDLMEPVRPFVESWVVELFKKGVLDKRCFSFSDKGCLLGKAGRESFYAAFEENSELWRRKLQAGAVWLIRLIDLHLGGLSDA